MASTTTIDTPAENRLSVSLGQHSSKGRKSVNQDFHGALIPREPALGSKGIALALADGISSSNVSRIASETAVRSFLEDYYCTSDAWSVKKSARCVLTAINSWLHAQTCRNPRCFDSDRGYVCTVSAMVLKSATAHLFHVGDARIQRLHGHSLEQLTEDHRHWISGEISYLSRALGVKPQIEIDYRAIPLEKGDTFILTTDGVHEHIAPEAMKDAVVDHPDDLDQAARRIVEEALQRGSDDNLSVQIVRIETLPAGDAGEVRQRLAELPLAPDLEPRMVFDGYEIIRTLHISPRSHVHLALDPSRQHRVALKSPASDLRQDPVALERFLLEEWIARRLNSPHVVKPVARRKKPSHLYVVTEYVDGQTLSQWMADHPAPDLATVRDIVEQIGKGLRAFHRQEMIHQDLRPANVMIDSTGTAKIIDFGAVHVAGIAESDASGNHLLGTAQYAAPEYFLGYAGTEQSDIFSLGVIGYQMLTGALPYGTKAATSRTRAAQHRLRYESALHYNPRVPGWVDSALRKALHPSPERRYRDVSEFLFDLSHPRREFLNATRPPLIERNPVRFWQVTSALLAAALAASLIHAFLH